MTEDWGVALQRAVTTQLPRGWRDAAPWGFPAQAELGLIGGVFAAQVQARVVDSLASRYMVARPGRMLDNLADLAAIGADDLAGFLGDEWGASTVLGVPRRRVEVILEAARRLADHDIVTAARFREAALDPAHEVDQILVAVRGIGPVTADSIAVHMQADLRPDTRLVAFIADQIEVDAIELGVGGAVDALTEAARRMSVQRRVLQHALWRIVTAEDEPAADADEAVARAV